MQSELQAGRRQLGAMFAKFLPVLVPPWNRIGAAGDAARRAAGLTGLSLYGPNRSGDPHQVNTHLDIFDWKGARGPMARTEAYAVLCAELARRLDGDPEPVGILTHHLIHQPASWALLDELFAGLRNHPAVAWPAIPDSSPCRAESWTPHRRLPPLPQQVWSAERARYERSPGAGSGPRLW